MNVFLLFCLSAETVGKKKVSTNVFVDLQLTDNNTD